MTRQLEVYICTGCGDRYSFEDRVANMVTKTVMFTTFAYTDEEGNYKRETILRRQVVDWLCIACLVKDPDYNRKRSEAPGLRHTRRARTN